LVWGGVEGKFPGIALEVSERKLKAISGDVGEIEEPVSGLSMTVVLKESRMASELDGSNGEEG
jgi:hypothetical protein